MLTERQMLILQVLIDDFIESAQPVGSRRLSQKKNVDFSPATIRNVMADLEDMGYIEKPHTSSGRIPSEQGYRFYVDHLIPYPSADQGIHFIEQVVQDEFMEFEQIVQKSAEILSDITNYTTIILGPEIFETTLKQLQIVTLTEHTAVTILITNTGHVEHRSFTIPAHISSSDLEKIVNILNNRLHGVPLIHLPQRVNVELHSMLRQYVDDYETVYEYVKSAIVGDYPIKLYIGGKTNILMQPEFNNIEKVRSFYTMMENEDEITQLFKGTPNGIEVRIGNENKMEAVKDLSVITSSYHLGDGNAGMIGLLGPTRMEYRKVISLLQAFSNEMSDALYVWFKQNE
ncbi:Heat-inducible transcription repressor HrcA [Lentibacillus sp. JNUCC-1]|uniref:heat-inducible transcriptional repressor HrcA n=1 Tax=Lentibacillus sp. JNUCC-1 TaxID=2654513 RepID=UPI0012E78406|nr:heat-inducible transcriptional repressor HrcA [Lentibacillus sp. JNUCC-1]MUV39584.1 Heat-inducible transcription repressor HrcA [Lentibacillus sp. JNUCC-1]